MFRPLNKPVEHWVDQRIWLIGASSGIGAALARKLLCAGARVALSARDESGLQTVADAHGHAMVLPLDVLDAAAWQAAHDAICTRWNDVDMLIYCVADYLPESVWEMEPMQAHRTIAVNLSCLYDGLAQVLPRMLRRGQGSIALIASVAGYMGLPRATVYGPTKAALINLAEILYADLHARGLNVFLINPGFVATRLTAKNAFSMPALQSPEDASRAIMQGMQQGDFEIHFPKGFTFLMKFIQVLPYRWRFALLSHYLETA
ncbi:MAG: SDR family NAD(P)-dependent oxidoreductase [Pseudomonadales bacterium]|nr:SDR family NAD(P)-dependent oxidoreductase [Pseudomonadales bacterium]